MLHNKNDRLAPKNRIGRALRLTFVGLVIAYRSGVLDYNTLMHHAMQVRYFEQQ